VGSVTEQFTAAAILKLREQGKLDIEGMGRDVHETLRAEIDVRLVDRAARRPSAWARQR
jgi:hypothetical protein